MLLEIHFFNNISHHKKVNQSISIVNLEPCRQTKGFFGIASIL